MKILIVIRASQEQIETTFLLVALACIPVMLAGKPIYLMIVRKRQKRRQYVSIWKLTGYVGGR